MSWAGIQGEAFLYLAVFARVGTALMLLPGLGEISVPGRLRMSLALMLTLAVAPAVAANYPPLPETLAGLTSVIMIEIAVGLILGGLVRMFMMAVQTAGALIATTGGLAFAQNFDPTVGIQGALISSFLAVLATTLILQTDLHHVMLMGVRNSYGLFPVGATPDFASLADLSAHTFGDAFKLGLQLSSPFIAFSLVFYAAMGAISKLMPQLQIFFLAMPVNILLGFVILSVTISTLMLVYMDAFEAYLHMLFG